MMQHFPIQNGVIQVPALTYFGVLDLTFHGDSSITVLDPDGNVFFQGGIPGAKANETATVTLNLSSVQHLQEGAWTVRVTGNVQGTLTTS